MIMDIENAISSQSLRSPHKKKKTKKHGNNLNAEANHDCAQEGFSAPADVDAATIEPLAIVTLELEKRKKEKRRKRRDNLETSSVDNESTLSDPTTVDSERTLLALERAEGTSLKPAVNVTSGNVGSKKETKMSDDVKMETLDNDITLFVPTKPDDTSLKPTPNVALREKNKKRKPERSDDVEMKDVDDESTLLVSSKEGDSSLEPAANVASEKKRRKKKKAKTGGNFEAATSVDTSIEPEADGISRDEKRKKETNESSDVRTAIVDNDTAVLVTTGECATGLDPIADDTSGNKKRKKKKKTTQSGDVETTTVVDNQSKVLVPTKAEDTSIEPAADGKKETNSSNGVEMSIVDNNSGVDATNLDNPIADATSGKKKINRRVKKTCSGDVEPTTVDNESKLLVSTKAEDTSIEPAGDGISRDGERKEETNSRNDAGTEIVDNGKAVLVPDNVDGTNLDLRADVAAGKKKRKKGKRTTLSDNVETATVDNESVLSVPRKAEDTCTEPTRDGTSRDAVEAVPVNNDSATNLDPIADVTSGKKKRKKVKKKSHCGDVEMTTVDNQSTISVPTKAEDTSLEPASDVTSAMKKRQRKREKNVKTNESLELTMVDNERTLLGNNTIELDERLDPEVNADETLGSEKLVSESLVNPESSEKKRRKESTKSQNHDAELKNPNGATLEPSATERDVPLGYPIFYKAEGTASEKPAPSADLGCSNKRKKNRKKKKVQGPEDIYESNDKVGESLQDAAMDDVMLDKMDSAQSSEEPFGVKPVAENPHAESSLSLLNGYDKASDVCDMDSVKDGMNLVTEAAGLNSTSMKENSPTIEAQTGRLNGVNNSSVNRHHHGSKADSSLESGKIITYKRERRKVRNSSNKVDGVLKKVVDLSSEKESANFPDLSLDAVSKEGNISQVPNCLPERNLVPGPRKKLLILDVNGILVDFVENNTTRCRPDIRISGKEVFKRPYCDEFLEFCFERFTVAVWTSRLKWNMVKVIDFLFGDSQKKLLFSWDRSQCTMTQFNTLENRWKPLVLKELRKVWDKVEPDLPYEKGDYHETNTLLLDDSPYKALRNPVNTAIFPKPYKFTNQGDKFLGPGGDLRTYLEGLHSADNVQKYVEQNPLGQPFITESHRSWGFYRKVVEAMETQSKP